LSAVANPPESVFFFSTRFIERVFTAV